MAKIKGLIPILILLILTIPLILPLLKPGFFVTDDGNWMVIRLASFHSTLRTGQFPVRYLYSLNHGYGYPVLNFNYPLPFYMGEIVHLIGFGFVDSTKILFGASFILSALGMYFLVSNEMGKRAGLVAGIIYVYAPYRIFDVYRRGSIGEAVAFIFLPLILLFLQKLYSARKLHFLALAASSYAALILSHNIIAFIFTPILLTFTAIKIIKCDGRLWAIIYSIAFYILALSVSCFFWFPAIYDLQFTKIASRQISDFKDYFLGVNNFPEILGLVIPVILAVSIIFTVFRRKRLGDFATAVTILSIFMTLPISLPIWEATPLPKLVQFPWRFISVVVFGSSLLAGQLASLIKRPSIIVGMTLLIVFFSLPLIKSVPSNQPDSYYSTNDDSTTIKNEYMPKWVKVDPQQAAAAEWESISPSVAQVNRVYFPGLKVYLDSKEVSFDYEQTGFPRIKMPPGKHDLSVKFTETPIRMVTDIISLIGLGFIFILLKPRHDRFL